MKKTYFLNSKEIVHVAENWASIVEKLTIPKTEKRNAEEAKKNREQIKLEFLNENAEKVIRVSERPSFFYETDKEMQGKFGWFSSYGKVIICPNTSRGGFSKPKKNFKNFSIYKPKF